MNYVRVLVQVTDVVLVSMIFIVMWCVSAAGLLVLVMKMAEIITAQLINL